jgi:hypothetical protein
MRDKLWITFIVTGTVLFVFSMLNFESQVEAYLRTPVGISYTLNIFYKILASIGAGFIVLGFILKRKITS